MSTKLVLLVLTLGTLMAAVDTTIVLLALPTITVDLNTDLLTSIWVLLAYLLVLAILTTQTGRLGDILGRSKIYNFGFILFTLASALAGASANIYELITFRVIQAIGGAMLTANSNAIIADIFPPQERGRAYGITSLGWNIGALLGIVLGGILTTFFGWRFIFYINVPIGIIAVIIGLRNIKDINKVKSSLDITGALILGVSLSFISLSVMFIAANGMSMQYLLELLVGVLLIPLFIYNEIKVKMPMINISVFKIRLLSFSLISSFLQGVGALALTFLLIMYLQGVRGLSPLDSSLLLTPSYIIASVLAPIMGRRADKGSPGLIAGIGLIFIFISLILYYFLLTPTTPLYDILWISAITGSGSAMFWPSNAAAIMYYAPKQYYGSVSGISRTLGSIGTVLSYVMSISIATLVIPRYIAFEILLGTNALDPKTGADFVQGLHFAFLVSAVIIIIASIFSMASGIKRKLSS
ncbi:MFS transporter [Sulfolobus sp. S-194]|uniref:MFS transporter n=1 Tax=Sulfolobus sp. S-194 TaxID=2512240 RepID=UPI001436DABF|nr:MFS transporter [Sulfolobus sp. S-194]QIW24589.1 MFS transporter [Sulfolobus sp. S-194]